MTTLFVTRHPGAVEWARRRGIAVDRHIVHLHPDEVGAGDTVIGTLPVNLAAEVCARGGRYINLSLDLPPEARGPELSAAAGSPRRARHAARPRCRHDGRPTTGSPARIGRSKTRDWTATVNRGSLKLWGRNHEYEHR